MNDTQNQGLDLLGGALMYVGKMNSHGILQYDYLKKKTASDLLKTVLENQPYYQNVFELDSEFRENNLDCEIYPSQEAVEKFKMEDLQMYMTFKVKSFQEILKMRNFSENHFEMEPKENLIYFKLAC